MKFNSVTALKLCLLFVALAVPWFVPGRYVFQILINCCLFAIGSLSMNLILGFTGQASLAHAGFFGIGAYGVALLTKAGVSFWIALPASALLAAAVGVLVGIPTLRTRGSYFAISTMCMGVIIEIVAGNWISLTGGQTGVVGIPAPTPVVIPGIGEITFTSQTAQYYLVLAFLLFTLAFMHRLVYSLKGLGYMAVRNNEVLADAVGQNTFAIKLQAFIIANFFVALAGGIYASLLGSISPTVASINITFNFLVYLLLGGMATLAGPVIGAFTIPILMEYLQALQQYSMIIFGVLLILVIIYFPRGFMGGLTSLWKRIKGPVPDKG